MPIQIGLTPREAARVLGVRLDSIYGLIWAGKLQAEKNDGRWLIPAAAVHQRRKSLEARSLGRTIRILPADIRTFLRGAVVPGAKRKGDI